MKQHEVFESVPGILRPFKTYVDSLSLSAGDQIAYYGCPGTCTPFIELLAFAAWRASDMAAVKRWTDAVAADAATPQSIRTRVEVLTALTDGGKS